MPARRVAAGFRRRELAGRREGCASVRRGRREKALDKRHRLTEAILLRVEYADTGRYVTGAPRDLGGGLFDAQPGA
jgi:hypothetical protein